MHVLSYLWNAAYIFHAEGTEEARLWVRSRLLAILQGRVSNVAAGMRQSATKRKLTKAQRAPVDRACNYFLRNKDRMRYHEYLAAGLAIASGGVEGACGHGVRDRIGRTCATWDLELGGAEGLLKARALDKSGDLPRYWNFHMAKENERLYAEWRLPA